MKFPKEYYWIGVKSVAKMFLKFLGYLIAALSFVGFCCWLVVCYKILAISLVVCAFLWIWIDEEAAKAYNRDKFIRHMGFRVGMCKGWPFQDESE